MGIHQSVLQFFQTDLSRFFVHNPSPDYFGCPRSPYKQSDRSFLIKIKLSSSRKQVIFLTQHKTGRNIYETIRIFCYWYKKAADIGDGNGARNYTDMLMTGQGVQQDQRQAFHYYAIAADAGVPKAAFVMGELFRNSGDRENALKAYKKAVAGGYTPAQQRINQMKSGE